MILPKSSKGFTLIELLIVIAIIGLLAGVLVVLVNPVTQIAKAHDLERKNTLRKLQGSLEQYFADNGAYPSTGGAWYSSDPDDNSCCLAPSGDWIPGLSPKYISELPQDPTGGQSTISDPAGTCQFYKRAYLYRSDGQEYSILAHCSPEGEISTSDPLYDSGGGRVGTGWQVCEGQNACLW